MAHRIPSKDVGHVCRSAVAISNTICPTNVSDNGHMPGRHRQQVNNNNNNNKNSCASLTRVTTPLQTAHVAALARQIWTEHFTPVIGQEQVHYMLDRFQSESAIAAQMKNEGYEYYLLSLTKTPTTTGTSSTVSETNNNDHDSTSSTKNVGYVAVVQRGSSSGNDDSRKRNVLHLSKIYVAAPHRGKGLGLIMLELVERITRTRRLDAIWLTVNKKNQQAIEWYRHVGFRIVDSIEIDIGNGFVMDDYRMEKNIEME